MPSFTLRAFDDPCTFRPLGRTQGTEDKAQGSERWALKEASP